MDSGGYKRKGQGREALEGHSRNDDTLQKQRAQVDDRDRLSAIMTPAQDSNLGGFDNTPSEQNSSHYHRFKRHSTGYQSQGPYMYGANSNFMDHYVASINQTNLPREQAQTAHGPSSFMNGLEAHELKGRHQSTKP